jgi:hypothetical protein
MFFELISKKKKYWVMCAGMELGDNGGRAVTAEGQARGDKV